MRRDYSHDETDYKRLDNSGRVSAEPIRENPELNRPNSRDGRSDAVRPLSEQELENERLNDRGLLKRAGDEVLSWLGDNEADKRRRMDALENERRSRLEDQRGSRLEDSRVGQTQSRVDEGARNVMTHTVVCVNPSDTVEHAARLMNDCDCGALPVIDKNNRLMGIITDRDIAVRLIARGIDPRRARVFDCMTSEVYTCYQNNSVEDCLREMANHQVRRMPIVDNQNHVIGIVSQSDLAIYAKENPSTDDRHAIVDMLSAVSEPSLTARR